MDNYKELKQVYEMALHQASVGKGKERHANDEPFTKQLIFIIEKLVKSFQLGQAIKKIVESQRLDREAAIRELLGAQNYIAAKIIELSEITDTEIEKFTVLTQNVNCATGKTNDNL